MNKAQKLRFCNWTLLILMILTLASGIQLEATGSRGSVPVWLHIIVASVFISFCIYHISLHFGWQRWLFKFRKLKSNVTRILWWISVVTTLSAFIALIHWLGTNTHSPIGGIHGKIGFLMIAFAIGHTIKRFYFFKR